MPFRRSQQLGHSAFPSVIPCEVIQIGRSTILKKKLYFVHLFIHISIFKNIFKKIQMRSVLPVQPFYNAKKRFFGWNGGLRYLIYHDNY
jgi:hypothetical protein